MSDVSQFIGAIAAKVVRRLIDRGHPGVRLQNVTAFEPVAMLTHLNEEPRPRVAVTGANVKDLARATKYPPTLITDELSECHRVA